MSLTKLAAKLAKRDRMTLSAEWHKLWLKHDEAWLPRLKWLNRWIAPRGKKYGRTIRRAGGLSLKRIATFTSLYQVQKAFFTRLRPNIAKDEKSAQLLVKQTGEQTEKVQQLRTQIAQIEALKPEQLMEALRILNIDDPTITAKIPELLASGEEGAKILSDHYVMVFNNIYPKFPEKILMYESMKMFI